MKNEVEEISSRSAELCAHSEQQRWYCVRTQNKREQVAAAHLQKLPKVEVFNPHLHLMRCTRRGRFCNIEPLFPSYLFARFDLEQMLEKVNCTPAVKFVLRFGGRQSEIPDMVIVELQQQLGEVCSQVLTDEPIEGEEVEIASGAFTGTKALVTHVLPAKQRVQILLDVMGRSVTAELSLDAVLFNRRNGAQLALTRTDSISDHQTIIPRASLPRLAPSAV